MGAGMYFKALVAALAFAVAAGCAAQGPGEWLTVGPESRQGDVSVFRDIQFADIPVPEEYVLLPRESSSFQGSLFRNAFLVYQGFLEWTQALDFYREQLPRAGWQLNRTDRGYDFRVLYFDKDQEKKTHRRRAADTERLPRRNPAGKHRQKRPPPQGQADQSGVLIPQRGMCGNRIRKCRMKVWSPAV